MQTVYFQVPDARSTGQGVKNFNDIKKPAGSKQLKVLGGVKALRALSLGLGLASNASASQVYAAVCNFQRLNGLTPDGAVGALTWQVLNEKMADTSTDAFTDSSNAAVPVLLATQGAQTDQSVQGEQASQTVQWRNVLSAQVLVKLFPYTKLLNLQNNAPYVLAALDAAGYTPFSSDGAAMCKLALATIRAETEGFEPISELRSRFNTGSNGVPFGLYDPKSKLATSLGNTKAGDGATFKGRGFVQLTGRANYTAIGKQLGLPLSERAFIANLPEIAAAILVQFLSDKQAKLLAALEKNDLALARKLVNGGSHGFDRFQDCCKQWDKHIEPLLASIKVPSAASSSADSSLQAKNFLSPSSRLALPVKNDPIDLRDNQYHPPLGCLPECYPSAELMEQYWQQYTPFVLNQGPEGACTGFGLACTINYLLFSRALAKHIASRSEAQFTANTVNPVSPRMLYEFARRYDEFEGDDYEGSSCRGALKGWHKHGVCTELEWPYKSLSPKAANWASAALNNTLGVYYRIDKKNLVDLQAAIVEVGAVFVSASVHEGWTVKASDQTPSHETLPLIDFQARTTKPNGAHAFALVGYNRQGFIVQNSWGLAWGVNGFAVITYADWLANSMDAWVATLGVPGVINNSAVSMAQMDQSMALNAKGVSNAKLNPNSPAAWALAGAGVAPSDDAIAHSLVLDNGMIKELPTVDILGGLSTFATQWPKQWFDSQTLPDGPRHLVLVAHGGLNDQADGMKRAGQMTQYFLQNGIYPIFLVWKTGIVETFTNIAKDALAAQEQRAGGWLSDNVSDPLIERTIGTTLARSLWNGMKQAATHANSDTGGLTQLAAALQGLLMQEPRLQVHLIAHSAGSILLGGMLDGLIKRRVPIASAHLMAPACTIEFANNVWLPHVGELELENGIFPLDVHALNDAQEQDDTSLIAYRKSLLYLVARGIEENRPAPLLGMHGAWDRRHLFGDWSGDGATQAQLALFDRYQHALSKHLRLHLVDTPTVCTVTDAKGDPVARQTRATTHGTIDDSAPLLLGIIKKILGKAASRKAIDLSKVP